MNFLVTKMNFNVKAITSLLFLVLSLSSCDDEEVAIPVDQIHVEILAPSNQTGVGDTVVFRAYTHVSDSTKDVTKLHVRWASDKDGVLYEHPASRDKISMFKTANLSRGIHEITLEVRNAAGGVVQRKITIYNVLHLTVSGDGFANKVEWTTSDPSVQKIKLFASRSYNDLDEALPVFTSDALGKVTYIDTISFVTEVTRYRLTAEFEGKTIFSNTAGWMPAIGMSMDFPLQKIILDSKRNQAYGIVNPGNNNENKSGYGLVFINLEKLVVDARVMEGIRFNDIALDGDINFLYASTRNRKVYKIDLSSRQVVATIDLKYNPRRIEIGSNNRLYYHVDQYENDHYVFRMVDLSTYTELPRDYSGAAGGSFEGGDFIVDRSDNTIYFSQPAKIKTTFDIFSDLQGLTCCDASSWITFKNEKLFVHNGVYNKNLVRLGSFFNKSGQGEMIQDCNEDATLAIGSHNIFRVSDRTIWKPIRADHDYGLFWGDTKLILIRNRNTEYETYRSNLYVYPFD